AVTGRSDPAPRLGRHPVRANRRSTISGLVGAVALALVVHRTADHVAQLVALRLEVPAVLVVRLDLDRLLRDGREPVAGDPGDLPRVVRQDADRGQPEVGEDLRADAVLARIGLEAELEVGLDRVEALLLQLVGAELVEQPDPAALLGEIEEDTRALLLDP